MAIGISLLGCGHPHVPDVLGVIASEPDLHLAAAWDEDRSAIPGVILAHAVREPGTAIERADAVVVCAPTDVRPGLCVQAARAGRPVLVEKPLARSAAEARAAAREISRSRTPVVAAMYLRQLPALQRLRGVLQSGLLGRPAAAAASWLHPGALDGWFAGPRAWMQDPRRAGVGGLGDLAIHLIDALTVLGAQPTLIAASPDRAAGRRGDVGGVALGRWGDVPLTLRTSWVTRPASLQVVINGSSGTAVLTGGSLELVDEGGGRERWVGAPPDAAEGLRAFAQQLRSRRLDPRGLDYALAAQAILEGASVVN